MEPVTTTRDEAFDLLAELIESGRTLKALKSAPGATPTAVNAAATRFDAARAAAHMQGVLDREHQAVAA